MKRFRVALHKPVSDVLRAFVTIEAETPEEAETKALDLDMSSIDFQFWQCGDNPDPITAEAEIEPLDARPDLVTAAQALIEACNPLPLNAKQHIAFAELRNAVLAEIDRTKKVTS